MASSGFRKVDLRMMGRVGARKSHLAKTQTKLKAWLHVPSRAYRLPRIAVERWNGRVGGWKRRRARPKTYSAGFAARFGRGFSGSGRIKVV